MIRNKLFKELLEVLEKNIEFDETKLFTQDAKFLCTAFGNASGCHEIKKLLKDKYLNTDYSKIRIFNNVIKSNETIAKQSLYTTMLFYKKEDSFIHIFQCGFLMCIEYKKENDEWKISCVKRRMTFECGNSLLTYEKWKLIDYSLMNGSNNDPISKEDSPWEINDNYLSDEEGIKECFYRYNWLIDNSLFEELVNVYTNPYKITGVKQAGIDGEQIISVEESAQIFKNKRNKMDTNKEKCYPHEACWNHISHFENIQIIDNNASAIVYRYEPNRIGTRFLSKENYKTIFYSGKWSINLVKDDAGKWKICAFSFTSGIIEDKNESDECYF